MNTGHFTIRELKYRCRAAAETLCRDHGYTMDQFTPADGRESINAPPLLQKRFREDFGEYASWCRWITKGTLLLWRRVSHEYDEWDCELATDVLEEILAEQNFDYDAALARIAVDLPVTGTKTEGKS